MIPIFAHKSRLRLNSLICVCQWRVLIFFALIRHFLLPHLDLSNGIFIQIECECQCFTYVLFYGQSIGSAECRMELVLHKSQFNVCNSKSWMAAAYRFVSEDQLSLIYLAIQSLLLLLLHLRINLKSHLNTLHATHFIFNLVILWCKILYSNGKLLLILFLNFAIDGTSCFNARTTKQLHID